MMKVGKVPENVLKRSVLRQIHSRREEVCMGAGVGEDCAAVKLAEDEVYGGGYWASGNAYYNE